MPEATLGVIVQQLGQAVQFHHRERLNLEQLIRKLHSVKDMSLNTVQQVNSYFFFCKYNYV